MGLQNKIANKVEVLKGKAKKTTGKMTGNPQMEVEGRLGQGKGNLKQAGEKVKDAGKGFFGKKRRSAGE
ncbi:MAG: CsbD family protein [Actinomycetota bacterium]|nr:CsbD family protein [Actinomycetota bacterium]